MAGWLLKAVMHLVMLWARIEAAVLPTEWLYSMGRASARTLFLWVPAIRRGLLRNARRLLGPGASQRELERHSVRVLEGFSRFFVELLTAPDTYPSQEEFLQRIEGMQRAIDCYRRGKGVIGISLHMGNMELGPMLLEGLIEPAAIVYRKDPFGLVEQMRSRARRTHGLEEIDTGSRLFGVRVLEVLRRGGFAFLLGDLGFEDTAGPPRGRVYPFLGGRARFLIWPARLALASGAPLLPCFVLRDRRGRYHARIEAPIEPEGTVDEVMLRLVAVYERYVRAYPDQWLILHSYWEEDEAGASGTEEREPEGSAASDEG
ncbi:MAG: lysophospholipid acyltransferase family protein [Planctomycetota bacterium]